MKSQNHTRKVGADYERLATEALRRNGYEILERNYRCRRGEIDLIATEGPYLVFCEVKYRKSRLCGAPFEAVDARKQRKICGCAAYYLMKYGLKDVPCRFDVVSIDDKDTVTVFKNAFPYVGE